MEESNLRKCKVCGELKIRRDAGKYPNKKDKRFIDEKDRQWSGNVCPTCHAYRNKLIQRNKRGQDII